ncbi:hypothetical protein BDZ85DRAFT_270725 [Elsinoe ampelina]|uniref:WW domain-containing protein n=1 Tax=Elsinoe ampelina TaxID=302913 RepID=A0A6A6FXT5_9PEZI|nr:hypothetical protein BDZ85DRAFT_270725 [Elsinoe ampelina]
MCFPFMKRNSAEKEKPLPEGWIREYLSCFKLYQYTNIKTGKQTFLRPLEGSPPAVTYPWEAKIDGKGRIYYSNHKLKTTTWKNPVDETRLEKEKSPNPDDKRATWGKEGKFGRGKTGDHLGGSK